MSGDIKRTIKLFCPSLSKAVQFVAWDKQRLDLGSIARAFGLEPSTLKLNDHFISRGVDLIASSVTWKSLLSFFSSRGLSTGATDSDALIVDGKLSKVGTKRYSDRDKKDTECDGFGLKRKQWLEVDSPLKKIKMEGTTSGSQGGENGPTGAISNPQFRCSLITEGLKRIREDEMVITAPCKKTRG